MSSQNSGRAVHVLYVEDRLDDRFVVEAAARSANSSLVVHCQDGFVPAIAYLGGEGVFADRQRHPVPAFVLLDYTLNGHTGLDLIRWLRADDRLKGLPVVMYSDSDRVERAALCYRQGANYFLLKARSFDRLKELIQIFARCFGSDPPCHDLLLALREYRPPP